MGGCFYRTPPAQDPPGYGDRSYPGERLLPWDGPPMAPQGGAGATATERGRTARSPVRPAEHLPCRPGRAQQFVKDAIHCPTCEIADTHRQPEPSERMACRLTVPGPNSLDVDLGGVEPRGEVDSEGESVDG